MYSYKYTSKVIWQILKVSLAKPHQHLPLWELLIQHKNNAVNMRESSWVSPSLVLLLPQHLLIGSQLWIKARSFPEMASKHQCRSLAGGCQALLLTWDRVTLLSTQHPAQTQLWPALDKSPSNKTHVPLKLYEWVKPEVCWSEVVVVVVVVGNIPWLLGGGGLSMQLGKQGPAGNILGWPAVGSPKAPIRQGPEPVNWPEKCNVKAPSPQWGSSIGSPLPQLGSCLMREWCEDRVP